MSNIHLASIDNFLDNALVVRSEALKQDFDVATEFQGLSYKGVVPVVDPVVLAGIALGLAELHGRPVKLDMTFYRLSKAGEDTPTWIHQDNSCSPFAAILHLTRPQFCVGGTAFWKHRRLGIDALPMSEFERLAAGMVVDEQFCADINKDGQTTDAWDMVALAPMKFNRMVVFPSNLFHSRWPQFAEGRNKDDGRLILVSFHSFV